MLVVVTSLYIDINSHASAVSSTPLANDENSNFGDFKDGPIGKQKNCSHNVDASKSNVPIVSTTAITQCSNNFLHTSKLATDVILESLLLLGLLNFFTIPLVMTG